MGGPRRRCGSSSLQTQPSSHAFPGLEVSGTDEAQRHSPHGGAGGVTGGSRTQVYMRARVYTHRTPSALSGAETPHLPPEQGGSPWGRGAHCTLCGWVCPHLGTAHLRPWPRYRNLLALSRNSVPLLRRPRAWLHDQRPWAPGRPCRRHPRVDSGNHGMSCLLDSK